MISKEVYGNGHIMNKKDANDKFNYFSAYKSQAEYAYELACNLQSAIGAGELGMRELMDALHTIENDADQVNHEIHAKLLSDFVVPLERDGMGALANALDDVNDAIEDVAIKSYCLCFTNLGSAGKQIVDNIVLATGQLVEVTKRLSERDWEDANVKHCLVCIQDYEGECDRIYIDAVHALYVEKVENLEAAEARRIHHSILTALETAMDAIEDAAEQIEALVANNI
jgi:uncharacterized protein